MDERPAETAGTPQAAPPLHPRREDKPWMVQPWTPEEAMEKARKGGLAGKGKPKWTWESRALRIVRKKGDTGERTHDELLGALVTAGKKGDVRAIELLAKMSGWTETKARETRHTIVRELLIRPDGDNRARIVEAEKPAELPAPSVSPDVPKP